MEAPAGLRHAAANLHAQFAQGPVSTTAFFFYFTLPPVVAWLGLAVAAAGGHEACLTNDVVCRNVALTLSFWAKFQYDGIPHVELAFIVFMLLWIATAAILILALLRR